MHSNCDKFPASLISVSVAPSAVLLLRLLRARWGKSWPPSWHHGSSGLTSRWVQKQQCMPLGCMPVTLMTTTGSRSWTSRTISTLCAGTRCCWPCVSWLQPCNPLSTLPIPHLPPCFGMTAYFSLQREYNRGIRWVSSFLSVHTRSLLPVDGYNVWYLDDGSVGGALEDISHDLCSVWGSELGLHLNCQKSEVISINPATAGPISSAIPGVRY